MYSLSAHAVECHRATGPNDRELVEDQNRAVQQSLFRGTVPRRFETTLVRCQQAAEGFGLDGYVTIDGEVPPNLDEGEVLDQVVLSGAARTTIRIVTSYRASFFAMSSSSEKTSTVNRSHVPASQSMSGS